MKKKLFIIITLSINYIFEANISQQIQTEIITQAKTTSPLKEFSHKGVNYYSTSSINPITGKIDFHIFTKSKNPLTTQDKLGNIYHIHTHDSQVSDSHSNQQTITSNKQSPWEKKTKSIPKKEVPIPISNQNNATQLENDIDQCIERYIPKLQDLSLTNALWKKTYIESLKKELLRIIQNAKPAEREPYKNLEKHLSSFSIYDFINLAENLRNIERTLPEKTKNRLQPYIHKAIS